jgi:hypothetical protein
MAAKRRLNRLMRAIKRRLLDDGRPRTVPDFVGTNDDGIIVYVHPEEFSAWLGRHWHELLAVDEPCKVYLFDPREMLCPPAAGQSLEEIRHE